jgi:polysaccharide biosynthesis/export protein
MKSSGIRLVVALLLLSGGAVCAQQPTAESRGGARADARSSVAVVIIIGAVQLPARVVARRPVRLNELFALAGGATERAGRAIRIYRAVPASDLDRLLTDDEFRKSVSFEAYKIADLRRRDEKANPFLQTGDVVYVEEPGVVYIAGDVKNPQVMNLTDDLTLRQAIAIAGGLLPGSEKERIIIRRQGIKPEKEIINLSRSYVASREKDITLQPNDVVCVLGKMSIGRSCPFADPPAKRVVTVDKLPSRTLY